jgi:hypothetical protein
MKRTEVKQTGLWTKSDEELERLADQVHEFNTRYSKLLVEMEARKVEGNENCEVAHWAIDFTFHSRPTQRAFWFGELYRGN